MHYLLLLLLFIIIIITTNICYMSIRHILYAQCTVRVRMRKNGRVPELSKCPLLSVVNLALPSWVITTLNKLFFNFLWGTTDKVKRNSDW